MLLVFHAISATQLTIVLIEKPCDRAYRRGSWTTFGQISSNLSANREWNYSNSHLLYPTLFAWEEYWSSFFLSIYMENKCLSYRLAQVSDEFLDNFEQLSDERARVKRSFVFHIFLLFTSSRKKRFSVTDCLWNALKILIFFWSPVLFCILRH